MTITTTHRLFSAETPHNITKRIWVVHGRHLQDWYFHNLFYGCVNIRRTIELWALENNIRLTITLTREGLLDFSGNPDPQVAENLFENSRKKRRSKYGNSLENLTRSSGTNTSQQDEVATRAQNTANQAESAAGGSGQAILNTLSKLTQLIKSKDLPSLIILNNFDVILEGLSLDQRNAPILHSIKTLIQNEWHKNISQNNLVIFLSSDKSRIEELFPPRQYPKVRWKETVKPTNEEIEACLRRISLRKNINFSSYKQIGAILANQEDTLELALWKVMKPIKCGETNITAGKILDLPPFDKAKLKSIEQELNDMVGLDDLKAKVKSIKKYAQKYRKNLLEGKELPLDKSMHMVFTGPPGTGKTTAARIVAKLYNALGLLKKPDPVEVTFEDIRSSYQEESGENMTRIIQETRGGVLFFDEAHRLGEERSMGASEMIKAIVPAAENYRQDLVFILAGYADQMHTLFNKDPGLTSRFPEHGRIHFHDYSLEQLWEIFRLNIHQQGYSLAASAEQRARAILKKRSIQPDFGNARGVRELVSEIIENHSNGSNTKTDMITTEDLPLLIKKNQKALEEALSEIDAMLGMKTVRDEIDSIIDSITYDLQEEEAGRGDGNLSTSANNMRFVGPPGTGKTTMGRSISKILTATGLSNGKFLEISPGKLKGRFIGDSEQNMHEAIEKGRGGVIFIDEIYSLLTGDVYAQNITTTLVEEILKDENRATTFIIAGYKDKVDEFLSTNSGLNRRFPTEINFQNFSPDDCAELAKRELNGRYSYEEGFIEQIKNLAQKTIQKDQKNFGNAGWVKDQLLESTIKHMRSRVIRSEMDINDPNRRKILITDLPEVSHQESADLSTCSTQHAFTASWKPSPEFCHIPLQFTSCIDDDNCTATNLIESTAFQITAEGQNAKSSATGFFVSPDGAMATSAHVVKNASKINVYCGQNRSIRTAQVVKLWEQLDLALLLVDTKSLVPFLPLGNSFALKPLSPLIVFGNAHVNPREPGRLVRANVARNDTSNPRAFESDGAIEKGFSGGPALHSETGTVVGIVRGGYGVSATEFVRSEQLQCLMEEVGYIFNQREDQ